VFLIASYLLTNFAGLFECGKRSLWRCNRIPAFVEQVWELDVDHRRMSKLIRIAMLPQRDIHSIILSIGFDAAKIALSISTDGQGEYLLNKILIERLEISILDDFSNRMVVMKSDFHAS
jgi:hypothetical protein